MHKVVLLVAATIVLTGCTLSGASTVPSASPDVSQMEMSPMPSGATGSNFTPDADTRVVEITGEDHSFAPNVITAKKGEKLAVKFNNTEGFHDFVITELGVSTALVPQGKSETVLIPTDKPGSYEFFCSVTNHRQLGMVGTLTIK